MQNNKLTFDGNAYRIELSSGVVYEGSTTNLIAHFSVDTITICDRATKLHIPIMSSRANILEIDGEGKTFEQAQVSIEDALSSAGGASSADAVSYDNSTSGLQSTNVQSAIDEVGANLGEISPKVDSLMDRADLVSVQAENVRYSNTISGLTATNAKNAIDEISDKFKEFIELTPTKSDHGLVQTPTSIHKDGDVTYNGFYAIYDVTNISKVMLNCKSTNSQYVGAFVVKTNGSRVNLLIGDNKLYNNEIVTIPQDSVTMYLNKSQTPPNASKFVMIGDVKDVVNIVLAKKSITHSKYGVNFLSNGRVNVFIKGYSDNIDLQYEFAKKSVNNLLDFEVLRRCVNEGEEVLIEKGDSTQIVGSTSDFLSPSILFAVNNIDGDFPTNETKHLTGGLHGYQSSTSSTASATARNILTKVYCDGKEVSLGQFARGNDIEIRIINRLQASNTEKADGSGREVVEMRYKIRFNGFKSVVDCQIVALEDIKIDTHYGLTMFLQTNQPFYFVGSRTKRQPQMPSASFNGCGDKKCNIVRQIGTTDTVEMYIDKSVDLGGFEENNWVNSCIGNSNKVYFVPIRSNQDRTEETMLSLNSGDSVSWRGGFDVYKTI